MFLANIFNCKNPFFETKNALPKHFFVFQELYTQDKFDRNVLPQQILKQKNTSAHKKASFLYAKNVLEKFAVTYSFRVPKDFQQTPNGNTAGKFKGILHAGVSAELNSTVIYLHKCMANVCLIDLLPLVMCKKHTTVHKKCVPLGTQKLFRKSLPLLLFQSSEKLLNRHRTATRWEIQRHFARSGEGQNEIQRQTCVRECQTFT